MLPEDTLYRNNLKSNNGGNINEGDYVFASDSTSSNHTFWNRPEILWTSSCEYMRKDVSDVSTVIDVVTACTLALMILSIFAAIFDCIMEGWAFKNSMDDDDTNDFFAGYYQKYGNLACTIGTLITTVVTFVFISTAKNFFRGMRDGNCSDSQTNETIGFIAKTAIELFDIWAAKLALDCVKIVYYAVMIWRGRHGDPSQKPEDTEMKDSA
jgi:hypothetical protein